MASFSITVDVDTPEEAEAVVDEARAILASIAEEGGAAAAKFAKNIIPKRSGRLSAGTEVTISGSGFKLSNSVYYGIFVDKGHMTPSHFKGRPAKHRSHVPGKFFSEKIWEFVQADMNERGEAFLALKR